MSDAVTVALIELVGSLLWPAVAVFGLIFLYKTLKSGLLSQILPHGGAISFGDARLEVREALSVAEASTDNISPEGSEKAAEDEHSKAIDQAIEPYDLVMETWYDLSDAITELAVDHGGEDDRRQVWTHLERLCDRSIITEAQKGAVRDLQKARNSIRRLQVVDRPTASEFAVTARKLTAAFQQIIATT